MTIVYITPNQIICIMLLPRRFSSLNVELYTEKAKDRCSNLHQKLYCYIDVGIYFQIL